MLKATRDLADIAAGRGTWVKLFERQDETTTRLMMDRLKRNAEREKMAEAEIAELEKRYGCSDIVLIDSYFYRKDNDSYYIMVLFDHDHEDDEPFDPDYEPIAAAVYDEDSKELFGLYDSFDDAVDAIWSAVA